MFLILFSFLVTITIGTKSISKNDNVIIETKYGAIRGITIFHSLIFINIHAQSEWLKSLTQNQIKNFVFTLKKSFFFSKNEIFQKMILKNLLFFCLGFQDNQYNNTYNFLNIRYTDPPGRFEPPGKLTPWAPKILDGTR